MKFKPRHLISLLIFSIVVVLRFVSDPAPDRPYYANKPDRPLVIAHQGGDGVWPGETMLAFQNSAALGVDVLEMDIHITADGELILMHDETVDRTTNGSGEIESMTLADLKELDAAYDWSPDDGQTFPYRGQGLAVATLEEVFQTFPGMRMTIEIKRTDASMAEQFCELIREYNMQDKVLAASFHDDRLSEFRSVCPEVATSSAKNETTVFVLMTKVFLGGWYSPAFSSLQVPEESGGITVMTPGFVRAAHARNLAVEPWTINDEETMRKHIEWGVDGIITDRPDILMKVLSENNP